MKLSGIYLGGLPIAGQVGDYLANRKS